MFSHQIWSQVFAMFLFLGLLTAMFYVGWNVIRIHLYIELEQDINTRVIIIYNIHSRIFMARARPYAKQF